MLTSYATGLLGITAVLLLWVGVQNAWRRTFQSESDDPDVLAGRPGCAGCERSLACERTRGRAARGGLE